MRFVVFCSVLGALSGMLLASSIETANACSCMDFNGENKDISVASIVQTEGEEDLVTQETERWDARLLVRRGAPYDINLRFYSEEADTTLHFGADDE